MYESLTQKEKLSPTLYLEIYHFKNSGARERPYVIENYHLDLELEGKATSWILGRYSDKVLSDLKDLVDAGLVRLYWHSSHNSISIRYRVLSARDIAQCRN